MATLSSLARAWWFAGLAKPALQRAGHPSPRDFIEISLFFVPNKSLPLPRDFIDISIFSYPEAYPSLGKLLKFQYFSFPKADPSPRDFIEISIFFVPETLPLPLGFY